MSEPSVPSEIKLLVVDNDRAFQDSIGGAAGTLGIFQILCCDTAAEALKRMDKFIPSFIVADAQLSGGISVNFVRRIRTGQTPAKADTLVMFTSKDWGGGLAGRLCDVGCHGLVRKPCTEDMLQRAFTLTLRQPTPFVYAPTYLGPDRRDPDNKNKQPNEMRRSPPRGGWKGSAVAFRKRPPMTIGVRPRPDAGSGGVITIGGGGGGGGKIGSGGGKVGGGIEIASTPIELAEPTKKKGDAIEIITTATKKGGPIDIVSSVELAKEAFETAAPTAKKKRDGAIEPPEAPKPPADSGDDDWPLTPALPSEPEETFNLEATVELHRQWIATNGVEGARADLERRALTGAALAGQNLAKANMRGADLSNADLSKAILVDADLRNARLEGATFNEAELAGAKVRHAEMQAAQLISAGLQGVDFAGSDMRGAVLTGADFAGANLLGADVRGTDLVGINLSQKQLDRAWGDETTRVPPGFRVGRRGG